MNEARNGRNFLGFFKNKREHWCSGDHQIYFESDAGMFKCCEVGWLETVAPREVNEMVVYRCILHVCGCERAPAKGGLFSLSYD